MRLSNCYALWECPLQSEGNNRRGRQPALRSPCGKNLFDSPSPDEAEIQGSCPQPLPSVRASAGIPAQVPALQDLLPRAGAGGRNSGSDEIELVTEPGPRFSPSVQGQGAHHRLSGEYV